MCVCVCVSVCHRARAGGVLHRRAARSTAAVRARHLALSAGIIGTAAIAAVLPAVPIEAFPWLHLGMGAAAAVVTWGAAALEQVTTRHELAVLAMQARMPQWRLRLHSLVTARTARLAEHHHKSALRILALLRTLPRAFWVVCAANALAWGLSDAFDAIGPAAFMVWCGLRHCCCCHCCFGLLPLLLLLMSPLHQNRRTTVDAPVRLSGSDNRVSSWLLDCCGMCAGAWVYSIFTQPASAPGD